MKIRPIRDVTIEELKEILMRGGTVVYPTDTVYGLLANANHEMAVRRIFHIKKREFVKPLPLFVDTIDRAHKLAIINAKTEKSAGFTVSLII